MGMTMAEKIIARAANKREVKPGEFVWANVDTAMMDDLLGPRVVIAEHIKRLGNQIWDKEKVVIISDHYSPAANITQAEILQFTRNWAKEYGISKYYEGLGPCHQVLAEKGFDIPGTLMVGTDSHTTTAGAFGCFGTGIGSTEMLGVLVSGQIWLRVPETMLFVWHGKLQKGVYAKDIILRTIKEIGQAGATYKVMEFAGSCIENLSVDERMAITNMAVEAGAKTGLMAPDNKVFAYLESIGAPKGTPMYSDPDAEYAQKFEFNADTLVPQIALPHEVDKVVDITEAEGEVIHQAYLGSCTNGRYPDLVEAAKILKGRKVHPDVRLLVSPASRSIYHRAVREGIIEILSDAGAMILAPSCGACLGLHSGILARGERAISSTNRNFVGRMGHKEAEIFLASPASVAAAAIEGKITDPRKYL
ncbi:3-isopropylmalate dehydratase large subunit [Sporolituus thermophilus]|uniref:3-isopropylmalate dehydratase large subunit n=1 Tax=Sporolituus thermophilus DSM 23256 TaxID=1123285 RepID=A0A1G7NAS2_9FIRM|nr:3-isopropylmalate dehydratase large subunit [Sporolituus thermophilus]SDF70400.1 3-isopropylmalate dehydratase, large subunit [Sporolituus thermophilus DSM 23256]